MEKLIAIIENYVEAEEINANSTFAKDLGLGSFDIVCLVADINKAYACNVVPQDFIKYKTVGELNTFITGK